MDINEEVEEVKKELLDLIVEKLKQNKIEVGTAQAEARDFLAVLPVKDHQDLLYKLKDLGEKYNEVNKVYLSELERDSDSKRDEALNKMRDHIKEGQIDHAINVAKTLTDTSSDKLSKD